jgi:hypothetical protein
MSELFEHVDEDDPNYVSWEKAYAQNGFEPGFLADPALSGLHLTMLSDHLDGLADEKFGADRWVKRDDVVVEEFEPFTRDHEYEETDEDDNPVLDAAGNPVMVQYHDDRRHFRMIAWFREKGPNE